MHKIDRLVNKEKVFYISEWVTVKMNVSKGEVYLEMSVYKTSKQNKILFMRVVQFFCVKVWLLQVESYKQIFWSTHDWERIRNTD